MLSTKDILHEIWKAAKVETHKHWYGNTYSVEAISDSGLVFRAAIEEGNLIVTDGLWEDVTKPLTFDTVEDLQNFLKYFL